MNFIEALHIWRRRWLSTAILLIIAVCAIFGAAEKLPRTYQSVSTLVLLPSHNYSKVNGGSNPYLSFNTSLADAAEALSGEVTSPRTAQALAANGDTDSYTVASESTSSQTLPSGSTLPGPFILVTSTGHDPLSVEHTLRGVIAELSTKLSQMQQNISPKNRISISTLSFSPQADESLNESSRTLVAIAIPLLVLALAAPLIFDARATRRRRRHTELSNSSAAGGLPPRPRQQPPSTVDGPAYGHGSTFADRSSSDGIPQADMPTRRSARR